MSHGDKIPEHEEWIIPHENADDPDTVQDEQEWAMNHHKFTYNALPITDMLPYVPPSMIPDQREEFASNIMYNEAQQDTSHSMTGLTKGYKIPRKSFQSYKINKMINDFNSSGSIPTSKILLPSSDREKEYSERKKKDRKRSTKTAI